VTVADINSTQLNSIQFNSIQCASISNNLNVMDMDLDMEGAELLGVLGQLLPLRLRLRSKTSCRK